MAHVITRTGLAALAVAVMVLSGCPPAPELVITPAAATFGVDRSELFITIQNLESGPVTWQAREVARADADAPWTPTEVPWLAADPPFRTQDPGLDRLALYADRSGLRAGEYNNVGVEILSGSFSEVIPVSIVVSTTLQVSPARISLRPGARAANFSVRNTGVGSLSWNVYYLPNGSTTAEPLPADFVVQPNPGSTASAAQTPVSVTWTEDRTDFGLLVDSTGGQGIVSVVFGAALPGLTVTPEVLSLYYDKQSDAATIQPASTLTITNTDTSSHNWTIEVRNILDSTAAVSISATPNQGATASGATTEVAVQVTDATKVISGADNYELIVRSGEEGYLVVPLVLETVTLPIIEASDPPAVDTTRPEPTALRSLDFGRETVQSIFWVVNVGPVGSKLFFKVVEGDSTGGEGYEDADPSHPLVADVSPSQDNTNRPDRDFYIPNTNFKVDGTPVTVTIDRTAMTKDVEYRKLTVEAWNEDYTQRLDAVDPVVIEVRVERPPLQFEGSTNRSRPPFLMRFVFLLRDTLGNAIPTFTAEDLAKLKFILSEDNVPLDLNETHQYVDGAENIKTNLVLLLDYTGSMYYSGTTDATTPAQPGEVLAQVNAAALRFLDDLPSGYRVSLMYYNDRQQANRVLYPFTTDREALKQALANFRMSPNMHGTSDIWDAVQEAINRLVAEDPFEILPFDEADLRAVVFVTDGQDNSSTTDAPQVAKDAFDKRVRLYPLSYSPKSTVETANLIVAAKESGGHLYSAGDARNLVSLLGNEKALVLSPKESPGPNQVAFEIVAGGTGTLNWNITREPGLNWITAVSPASGATLAGNRTMVTVTVDPSLAGVLPLNVTNGLLTINSNDGAGTARVWMQINDAGTVAEDLSVSLRDEPGKVWAELRNEVLFTYISPAQQGGVYTLRVDYTQPDNTMTTGSWQEDGIFYTGDVRTGQLSLSTAGIIADARATTPAEAVRAEAYLRADYVPRNVSQFRVRFYTRFPEGISDAARAAFNADSKLGVELAPDGMLVSDDPFASSWRLIAEGDGVYSMLTDQNSPLRYGSSGNLLRLRMTGLESFVAACLADGVEPSVLLDMRADNQIYVSPGTSTHPSETVYFLYPSGPVCLDRPLVIGEDSDIAGAARSISDLGRPGIDPEAVNAWDKDKDGLPDFQDPYPDNDTKPSLLTVPSRIDLSAGSVTVTIANNRLDTFTWSVTTVAQPTPAGSLAGRITINTTGSDFTLSPGESTTLTLSRNLAGLVSGTFEGSLVMQTDAFGAEKTPITVTVN